MTITSLDQVTAYPICWPEGKPRTAYRGSSQFKVATLPTAERLVNDEMRRWRAKRYIISQAPPYMKNADPGSALWFELPPKKTGGLVELRVLACDKFSKPGENLYAIGKTLEALRAVERYGAYSLEQAVEGAKPFMLPPPAAPQGPPWWEVLNVGRDWPLDAIETVARTRAKDHHPDTGGSDEAFQRFNAALAAARKEKGGK